MIAQPSEIARSAVAAHRQREGFEATQTVRAAGLDVVARIRQHAPHRLTVAYSEYRSPFLDLDEALTGNPEFTGEDLVGLSFITDGKNTWIHDPGKAVAWLKPHRWIADPLPGGACVGELDFLDTLTKDFLFRDAGPAIVSGRAVRQLGIKPKHAISSNLVRTTRFTIRRGEIAFDEETYFPLRITLHPIADSPLYAVCGPDRPLVVEYANVRIQPPDPALFDFAPPDGTRIFRETDRPLDDACDQAPFPIRTDALLDAGFAPLPGGVRLTLEDEAQRGYLTALLIRPGEDGVDAMLTLRAGNFLSRNMGRRRATIADHAESLTIGDATGRLLDRSDAWSQHLPNTESVPAHFELAWADGDVYWFLAAEGIDRNELLVLGERLLHASGRDDVS